MLYAVRGHLRRIAPHQVLLETGGFTISLKVPLSVSQSLSLDAETTLYTVLHFPREDGEATLYGFLSEQDRKLFLQLLRVRGLGAQRALAILSQFSADALLQIIHAGNATALSQVKGIGKKLAQQVILDMQPALKGLTLQPLSPYYEDAYEALIALGFAASEAHARLQAALKARPDAPAEELVQLALRSS